MAILRGSVEGVGMRKVVAEAAGAGVVELVRGLGSEELVIEAEGGPVAVLVPLERWPEAERVRLDWLKAAIAEGDAAGERGEERPLDDAALAELLRRATSRAA